MNWLKKLFTAKPGVLSPYQIYLNEQLAKIYADESIPDNGKYLAKLKFFLAENERQKATFIHDCSPFNQQP